MRRVIAGLCVAAMALTAACSGEGPPSSLFDSAGYHVSGDVVYYLNAFPGRAFQIEGADATTFEVLNRTYARDRSSVYVDGHVLPEADAATFQLIDRPEMAKDVAHVYARDRVVSDDPAEFELLQGDMFKDGTAVYRSDGSVLSDDPQNFEVISDDGDYLFSRDSKAVQVNGIEIAGADPATFRVLQGAYGSDDAAVYHFADTVPEADVASFRALEGPYGSDDRYAYWMGEPIAGADPDTFGILNVDFECSTDGTRAYYRGHPIAGADPTSFPTDRGVIGCSATSISFAPAQIPQRRLPR
jgi:hypothetical protein